MFIPAKKYDKGDKIGPLHLEILERLPEQKCHIICPKCGNQFWFPRISDVVKGKSTKCLLCQKKQASERCKQYNQTCRLDISGKRFGKLVALYPTNKRQNTYVVWHCKYDCGKEKDLCLHDLIKGSVISCSCFKGSVGEQKILNILYKNKINYIPQWTDNGKCRNPKTGHLLRFDVYLPDYNCCVEYNGKQHYTAIDYFGGEEGFQKSLDRDRFKKQYCQENNIGLVVIPYFEEEQISLTFLKEKVSNATFRD